MNANTTKTAATHLDALRDVAKAFGYTEIYDSGPCDGKLVIFGDAEHADDYLNGPGVLGMWIEVTFNHHGQVVYARLMVDNARIGQVARDRGTAGERLVWTAQLFIENPADR